MTGTARRRQHGRSPLQPELHRLGQMFGGNPLFSCEVRDPARYLHQSVTAPCRQVKAAAGGVEYTESGGVEPALARQRPTLQVGVEHRAAGDVKQPTHTWVVAPSW